jgi:hypothetical protein
MNRRTLVGAIGMRRANKRSSNVSCGSFASQLAKSDDRSTPASPRKRK